MLKGAHRLRILSIHQRGELRACCTCGAWEYVGAIPNGWTYARRRTHLRAVHAHHVSAGDRATEPAAR